MNASYQASVSPGEVERISWTFPESGRMLFGCHIGVPSQYDEGMVGTVVISR